MEVSLPTSSQEKDPLKRVFSFFGYNKLMQNEYKSGICNIGKQETNYRRNIYGYGGAVVSFALFIILVFLNFPILGYIILVIPIFASVHAFLEVKEQFCTAYGLSGRYNMNGEVGNTQDILSRDKRNTDRAKSVKMIKESLLMTVLITAILIAVSRVLGPILTI